MRHTFSPTLTSFYWISHKSLSPRETLCEIEAVTKAYAKRVKQTPTDKGVGKARKYLKSNGLVEVPYDEGVGFCVMRQDN